jgi:S-methylmethionine-dependent homocysteine/selenocysteine methylase
MILLDGATGTELERRGADLGDAEWSPQVIRAYSAWIQDIHRSYAGAGATVHTTVTFRAQPARDPAWRDLIAEAVRACRASIPAHHRVFGSMAPLEDCWRPDLARLDRVSEHRAVAEALVEAGVDGLLLETFPHAGELQVATRAAVRAAEARSVPVWASLTAGFRGELLSPVQVADGVRVAAAEGAERVLVNCLPAARALPWVEAIAATGLPFGVYANAGPSEDGLGPHGEGPERYAALAQEWAHAGACVLGGCCGTGPEHIRALSARFPAEIVDRRSE